MAAADIFAMHSLEEPFGLVYLEAMVMGLPVVGLATGGTPEVVLDGVTGLLSEGGDTERFTSNLLRLTRGSRASTAHGKGRPAASRVRLHDAADGRRRGQGVQAPDLGRATR